MKKFVTIVTFVLALLAGTLWFNNAELAFFKAHPAALSNLSE